MMHYVDCKIIGHRPTDGRLYRPTIIEYRSTDDRINRPTDDRLYTMELLMTEYHISNNERPNRTLYDRLLYSYRR